MAGAGCGDGGDCIVLISVMKIIVHPKSHSAVVVGLTPITGGIIQVKHIHIESYNV